MGFLSNFVNGAMNAGFNVAEGAANSAISAHYSKSLMRYQSKINRKDNEYYLTHNPGCAEDIEKASIGLYPASSRPCL